jgi:hypothetical protein
LNTAISAADVQYALDLVRRICDEVGPGLPGTPQERARAEIIRRELETHLGVENVTTEEFAFAPEAFLGSQAVTALLLSLAAVLFVISGRVAGAPALLTAAAAVLLSFSALVVFLFQFILAKEWLDPLFRKGVSLNVIGSLRRPGTREVKRLLILSGHHDSAWENNWLRWLGKWFMALSAVFMLGLLGMPLISAFQLFDLLNGSAIMTQIGSPDWLIPAALAAPAVIFTLLFQRRGEGGGLVPGAVDNLSACAVTVSMARFLAGHPELIPADTEIRFITFGSEEAGLRGSKRYVRRHLDELRRLDARLLNYEMIAHPLVSILSTDQNGFVKTSPAMVESLVKAAGQSGVPYKVQQSGLGTATDAASFLQAGLQAATLIPFKMPEQLAEFYHQRTDTPDKLNPEAMMNVLKVTAEWLKESVE